MKRLIKRAIIKEIIMFLNVHNYIYTLRVELN